nr:unnamed protein product [Digitaria exilis]
MEEEKQQQQCVAEEVLEKLCPPPRIQHIIIRGYFGRMLPVWMTVPASTGSFKSFTILMLKDLPCCTRLPEGLCRLPSLKLLDIRDVPAVKSVGSEFQQVASSPGVGQGVATSKSAAAFPYLADLHLEGLLSKIRIDRCPDIEVLEGVPSLDRLVLWDLTMEALPGYLRDVTPSSCQRDKIIHIGKHNINCIE